MRALLTPVAVLLMAAVLSEQQATFKAGTSIVPILTTVTDSQGRLVPNLEQDQFTIFDNGKPQPISFFHSETQPSRLS
jgi:hemolysin-activating ACP:hemolysin acyltransferase